MALGTMNNVHTQSLLSNILLTPKPDDSLGAVSFAIMLSNWLSIVTSQSVENLIYESLAEEVSFPWVL